MSLSIACAMRDILGLLLGVGQFRVGLQGRHVFLELGLPRLHPRLLRRR